MPAAHALPFRELVDAPRRPRAHGLCAGPGRVLEPRVRGRARRAGAATGQRDADRGSRGRVPGHRAAAARARYRRRLRLPAAHTAASVSKCPRRRHGPERGGARLYPAERGAPRRRRSGCGWSAPRGPRVWPARSTSWSATRPTSARPRSRACSRKSPASSRGRHSTAGRMAWPRTGRSWPSCPGSLPVMGGRCWRSVTTSGRRSKRWRPPPGSRSRPISIWRRCPVAWNSIISVQAAD